MKKVVLDISSLQTSTSSSLSSTNESNFWKLLEEGIGTVSTNVNFPSFLREEKSLPTRKPLAPLGERSSGSVC